MSTVALSLPSCGFQCWDLHSNRFIAILLYLFAVIELVMLTNCLFSGHKVSMLKLKK